MGCLHNSFNGGCTYFDGIISVDIGCDEDGNCICEDDECPSDRCTNYESDDPDDDEW